MGASKEKFGTIDYRSAYICVGYPGIGPSKALEAIQQRAHQSPYTEAKLSFRYQDGKFQEGLG